MPKQAWGACNHETGAKHGSFPQTHPCSGQGWSAAKLHSWYQRWALLSDTDIFSCRSGQGTIISCTGVFSLPLPQLAWVFSVSELWLPDTVAPGMLSTGGGGRGERIGWCFLVAIMPPSWFLIKGAHWRWSWSRCIPPLYPWHSWLYPPDLPFCSLLNISAELILLEPGDMCSLPGGARLSSHRSLVGSPRPELSDRLKSVYRIFVIVVKAEVMLFPFFPLMGAWKSIKI